MFSNAIQEIRNSWEGEGYSIIRIGEVYFITHHDISFPTVEMHCQGQN